MTESATTPRIAVHARTLPRAQAPQPRDANEPRFRSMACSTPLVMTRTSLSLFLLLGCGPSATNPGPGGGGDDDDEVDASASVPDAIPPVAQIDAAACVATMAEASAAARPS